MDINLPLILVVLVAVSGVIGLYDLLFLAKKRRANIQVVQNQFKGVNLEDEKQKAAYERAHAVAAQEPTAVEYAKSFFPVLFIVLVLRSFIVEPFQIPSESMVPTLEVGDFILVNKFTYGIRLPVIRTKVIPINEPKRGDVMVFFPPNETRYFIKRVIGLPGDTIQYKDNVLYINGEQMPQSLLRSIPATNPQHQLTEEDINGVSHLMRKQVRPGRLSIDGIWSIPPGHYFMMGDNRDNSSDSRVWGPVPEKNIVGKAFAIWMHWEDKLSSLPSFSRVGGIQ